jgi:hypothetical protein
MQTQANRPPKRMYLVNREFQMRYVRIAVVVGLCSTILTMLLILYPLFHFQVLRFPNFLPLPFLLGMMAASILNFLAVAMVSIIITHRVAGPMFALVRQFRLLQFGRLNATLKVRDSDDLKFVVRNFNEFVEYLIRTPQRDEATARKIAEGLARGAADPAAAAEAQRLAAALADELAGRIGPADPAMVAQIAPGDVGGRA